MKLGEAIKARRKQLEITQEQLAERVRQLGGSLTTSAVTRIERNVDTPRRQTVEWIDSALDADGELLDAFGYAVPGGLGVQVKQLRDDVDDLQRLATWAAGLLREVDVRTSYLVDGWQPSEPPARARPR